MVGPASHQATVSKNTTPALKRRRVSLRPRRRLPADADSHLFSVHLPAQGPLGTRVMPRIGRAIDRMLGLDGIYDVYRRACDYPSERPFAERLLKVLNLTYRVSESDMARIPRDGPLVVVANHCFGGIEGIILAHILGLVRTDARIMANYMLGRIPEMQDLFILVDPFGSRDAARANVRPLREALHWLRDGGCLGVFPSGEVAHFEWRRRAVVEGAWNATIAGLARRTRATVLPVYFEGSNTLLFHALGLVHPRLRTMRLPHEVLNKCGHEIPIHIGRPLPFAKLEGFETDRELADYLQMRTYNLRNRKTRARRRVIFLPRRTRAGTDGQAVAPPSPAERIRAELDALPAEQLMVESGDYQVWVARSGQIPKGLREIGRLREETFRAVGEGTGKPIDLDRYDDYYLHLFLWNRAESEIAAAYRLGATDEILPAHGIRGLYTSSLFRYRRRLLRRIHPALEMGRSFVRAEYQRNYNSLLLLWKGIATYVARHPRYRVLFGPVSITDSYRSTSRDLLVAFLRQNNFQHDLARLVRPRTPLRSAFLKRLRRQQLRSVVESVEEVESLIADIESELSGIPILLKQYLKLGGVLLGFNVDPKFNYVLDGLILVDLAETDPRILRRYMGAEGLDACTAIWKAERESA